MAKQERVIDPKQMNPKAVHQKRLCDFDTGKAKLQPEHQAWLDKEVVPFIKNPKNSDYWIDIYAYASKLGDPGTNLTLSINRAAAIETYLHERVDDVPTHVRTLLGKGESELTGGERDDSAEWRAAELFLFHTPDDSPNPPKTRPTRSSNWSVRIVAKGKAVLPGKFAQIAGVLVTFRNDDTQVLTHFFVPAAGVGKSLPKWLAKSLFDEVTKLPVPPKPGADSFAKVLTLVPFNMRMINGDNAMFILKRFVLSGQHWFTKSDGKRDFRTVTLCTADASKVPGTAIGGPLIGL